MITERFHFHRRNQAPEESVADFVAQLRRLATHCQFGEHLNEALRDRFVCGLKSEVMQKRLLSEVDLTLKCAIEIAQGIEAAEQHTQQLKAEAVIRKVSLQSTTRSPQQGTRTIICNHCGKSNHKASQCHFKDVICKNCKRKDIWRKFAEHLNRQGTRKLLKRNRSVTEVLTGLILANQKVIQILNYHCSRYKIQLRVYIQLQWTWKLMAKFSTWKLIREQPSLLFHKLRSRSYFPKYHSSLHPYVFEHTQGSQ